jgi:ribonucleoside-diphosphate reductase alpha chain
MKNWNEDIKAMKAKDFNASAPLDMTNISVNYDDASLVGGLENNAVFKQNVRQAMETAEPGFSFNFGDKQNETLRNACTEVTSEDDSDVCNLGSINMGNITSLEEFQSVVTLASKFLVCGTLRADLPYDKVYKVREKNRRLGLGLMGLHEWLLKRNYGYEVVPELHKWLAVYKDESKRAADEHCDRFFISRPAAYRAIAPTGSIGILAGTTTGIEPLFAVAYKRRFLTEGTKWKYQYVIDGTAQILIDQYGVDPSKIESAIDLSENYEQRIKFQADIQDYVDMSISSTINLPSWGSKFNNAGEVDKFTAVLAKYAPRLRGFTCYPDGSRGGQPLTSVPYEEALKHKDVVYEEVDICELTGGGSCGV